MVLKNQKKMKVKLTFTEPVLGTLPMDEEVFKTYIGSKAPDASTLDDEVAAIGTDAVVEKKSTIFAKDGDAPFLYDYQILGFFKGACSFMKRVPGTEASKVKAYKKIFDGLIFPQPRKIPFENYSKIGYCERPLRGQTPQGETVSLAHSEEIPAGSTITFDILMLDASYEKLIRELLDYGELHGIGQWRNSGKGRFKWEEIKE